jgi:hypothetical protein
VFTEGFVGGYKKPKIIIFNKKAFLTPKPVLRLNYAAQVSQM